MGKNAECQQFGEASVCLSSPRSHRVKISTPLCQCCRALKMANLPSRLNGILWPFSTKYICNLMSGIKTNFRYGDIAHQLECICGEGMTDLLPEQQVLSSWLSLKSRCYHIISRMHQAEDLEFKIPPWSLLGGPHCKSPPRDVSSKSHPELLRGV